MHIDHRTTFNRWLDGDLTDQEAIEAMARQLAGLEDQLEPLHETEKILRGNLSLVVERQGGKYEVPGVYSFAITSASVTTSYDAKALDGLVARLVAEGQGEIAQQIAKCRKESSRAGGLRVSKSKG